MNARLSALLAALFLTVARSDAQTVSFTIVTNPPQGGTVSGAGMYPTGSGATITTEASNGWYISNIDINPSGEFQFIATLAGVKVYGYNGGDLTTITNDTEQPTMNANNMMTVTFARISPAFTQTPNNVATVTGSQAAFTAVVVGRYPDIYQWQNAAGAIPGATNATLTLTNPVPTNSGTYNLIVTNAYGMTNTSAELLVQDLLVSVNGAVATNAVTATNQAFVTLQSRYTGPILYSLDGSDPDYTGTEYSGPFYVFSSCTLRAVGYREDFLASALSETIPITIPPVYSLDIQNNGGGTVNVTPPGTDYTNGTLVTLSAAPDPGWTFMGWDGELSGMNPTNEIVITHDTTVGALFGTTLSTSAAGNGTITVSPNFPLYPGGSEVTLEAVPSPGSYLALWDGVLSGNQNPASVYIGSPALTVSALFGPLPSGKVTLTVLANGGFVDEAIVTNLYAVGGTNELFAYPYSGQQFLGWSGDASGTNNPLPVVMTASKVITANFSKTASVNLIPNAGTLDLSLYSIPGTVYQIDTSSNLTDWTPFLTLTNYYNLVNFSDSMKTNVPAWFYRATLLP